LRPSGSGGPIAIVLLAAFLVLFMFLFFLILFSHGGL
jgi:hypothetical protein